MSVHGKKASKQMSSPSMASDEDLLVSPPKQSVSSDEDLLVSPSRPSMASDEDLLVSPSRPSMASDEDILVSPPKQSVPSDEDLLVSPSRPSVSSDEDLLVSPSRPSMASDEDLLVSPSRPSMASDEDLLVSPSRPSMASDEDILVSPPRQSVASDEDLLVYCQPCDDDGQRLPAHGFCTDCKEHLCRTCFAFHKKHRLSRHHNLLDATSMPKTLQQPSISKHTIQSNQLTTPCSKHPKEMIKLFCNDHKELICNICATLEHTPNSCKVSYIPDISGESIKNRDNQRILKTMNDVIEKCKTITEVMKENVAKSNSSLTDVLADIKKFRKELNQTLDELERHVEEETMAIKRQNESHQKIVEARSADVVKSLLSSFDTIKQLNDSNEADKLFVEIKLADEKIETSKRNLQYLKSFVVYKYDFKPNEAIRNITEKHKSFGTLMPKSKQMKPKGYCYHGHVCTKLSKDGDECQISGMMLLTPDTLIIVDQGNKSLKVINTNRQFVNDHFMLHSRPRGITRVAKSEIAVTFPTQQTIKFFSVTSNRLVRKRYIRADGDCHGISCYQDKLAVSFYNPPKLQILDLDGNVLTAFRGAGISSPLFITSNSESIFVSDWRKKSVMRFNWQGELIAEYGGMVFPTGSAVTDEGTLIVCDSERNVIEEITEDCSSGKVLLKNLTSPYVVCWCAETKKLYYCSSTLDTKNDNFLKIYRLS